VVFEGVLFEELGEMGDFGVGDAGVGFADVEEVAVGGADGEGVVAEERSAASVAVFGASNDDIEGGKLSFELDPGEATATGLIGRGGGLQHDSFVGPGASVGVGTVDIFGALDESGGRDDEAAERSFGGRCLGVDVDEHLELLGVMALVEDEG